MLTLGEAVNEARSGHPAFRERRIPGPVIRKALRRYERELYAEVLQRDPQTVASTDTIDLSSHTVGNAYTLSGTLLKPLGGQVHFDNSDRKKRLRFVPYKNRFRPTVPFPAYYLDGDIYLVGKDSDWHGVSKVDVVYVAEPTLVSATSDTFSLPEGAQAAIVARAELEMAKRAPVDDKGNSPNPETYLTLFQRAENRFLNELAEKDRAEETIIREEW